MRYTTTVSGVEPVTMQQVKDHLRITWEEEDALIYSFLVAAREYVEKITSQAVIPQTINAYYDNLPVFSGSLSLPLSNAVAITSVKYLDSAYAQITMPSSEYYLTVGQPNKVFFKSPAPASADQPDSVEIIYTAGYGSAPFKPFAQAIRASILVMVADLYENRESQSSQKLEQNMTVERLLGMNRELGL
jgi:uncharacterized phiE125 gp8 family phage protein